MHGSKWPINSTRIVQLLMAAEEAGGEITLDFQTSNEASSRAYVVFDAAEAKACSDEILSLHKVPSWCSPELLIDQA